MGKSAGWNSSISVFFAFFFLCFIMPSVGFAQTEAITSDAVLSEEAVMQAAPIDSVQVPDAVAPDSAAADSVKGGETQPAMSALTGSPSGDGGQGAGVNTAVPQSVISTGAASYRIPLETPPGRLGMGPNLALTYNSSQQNGWIGVGWSMDIGAIQRNTKHGLQYGNLQYVNDDFVIVKEGYSAELVARADWGTDYFGAKIEGDFTKFYLDRTYPADPKWIVTTKDGRKFFYGSTSDSRQTNINGTFKWCLERVQDTNGNYMTISYDKDQGEIYPRQIDYTGHTDNPVLGTTNKVLFIHESRSDVPDMYTTNALVKTARRLQSIEIYANDVNGVGQLVRKYTLTYTYSGTTGNSVLSSVTQNGTDGTALPPTIFQIPVANNTFANPAQWHPALTGIDWTKFWLADFNGDGKMDIIYRGGSPYPMMVMLSNGDSFATPAQWYPALNVSDWTKFWLADVNGDGKTDIIYWNGSSSGVLMVMVNNGNGFNAPASWSGSFSVNDWSQFWLADFNGDGKTDIMYQDSANHALVVQLSIGCAFAAPTQWYPPLSVYSWSQFWLADFNGDGKTDIMYRTVGGFPLPAKYPLKVMLNNGNGFNSPVEWYSSFSTALDDWTKFWLVDFNGDGKTDIVYRVDEASPMKVMLNNGNGFDAAVSCSPSFSSTLTNWLADFNGDGKMDVMYKHATSFALTVMKNNSTSDLLTSISNGIGGVSTINYTPSSAYSNNLIPYVIQTASSIIIADGIGGTSTTNYTYSGGLFDYLDREFRGFRYAKQANPDGTTAETWFHQKDPETDSETEKCGNALRGFSITDAKEFKGRPCLSLMSDSAAATLSKVATTWGKSPIGSSGATWVTLNQKRSDVIENGSSTAYTLENYTSYDANCGGLKTITVSGTGAESVTTSILYANQQTSGWVWRTTQTTTTGSTYGKVRETYLTYDTGGKGNLLRQTLWLNGGTNPYSEWTYDTYGNKWTEKDPRGNITTIDYDTTAFTYPIKITSPSTGGVSHIKELGNYDYRFGKPQWTKDENSSYTNYTYDQFGRQTQTDFPDGGQATTEFHLESIPVYTIERVKETSTSTIDKYDYFDGLGRPIQTITFGEPNSGGVKKSIVSRTIYDTMGRISDKRGPFFSTDTGTGWPMHQPSEFLRVTTSYDSRGRVSTITHYDGTYTTLVTNFTYSGLSTTVTDPAGKTKKTTKDYLGRLVQVQEDGDGTAVYTTNYAYNAAGDLLTVTDHKGNVTRMEYDTIGRKKTMTDPDMGNWQYSYDANGNLLTQLDAKSQTITFTYDELNRVKTKTYSTGDPTVTYTYDNLSITNGKGRLCRSDNSNVTITYKGYDAMGRVLSSTKKITGDTTEYTTQTTYDFSGKPTRTTYPDGFYINYAYYPGAGLLYTATGSDNVIYAKYTLYEPSGKIGQIDYPNYVATRYTYDQKSGRLTGLVTDKADETIIQSKEYYYSRAGDIQSIIDRSNPNNVVTYTYTYDDLHRLRGETNTGTFPSLYYTYNEIGNIMTKQVGTNTLTYTYLPGHPHAVSNINLNGSNYPFLYDNNGNMTSGYDLTSVPTLRTFTYNADNMPIQITRAGVTTNLVYDSSGERAKKVSPSATVYYVGSHYEVQNGVAVKHIFAGNLRIAKISNGVTYYFHKDHLGSSAAMTDSAANVVEATNYMPFGEQRAHTGTTVTGYKFTDQEFDAETGLYYYHARYYDPTIGRFISADTVVPDFSNPQDLNRYTYCGNNPLIYTDPTGHLKIGKFFKNLFNDVGHFFSQNWRTIVSVAIAAVAFYAAGELIAMTNSALADAAVSEATELVYLSATQTASIHAAAGGFAGGISSAINHGNIALGALTGGISAGIASYAGGFIKDWSWGAQLAGRTAIGGASGGITSAIYGGNFWKGFVQGAEMSTATFLFNESHGLQEMFKALKFAACAIKEISKDVFGRVGEHVLLNELSVGIGALEMPLAVDLVYTSGKNATIGYSLFNEAQEMAENLGRRIDACKTKYGIVGY